MSKNFQKFHVSVKALIKNSDKFLLLQECDGVWEAPGGRIDENELIEETLLRELKEELNFDLSKDNIGKLIGIDQRYDYKFGDGWALMTFFYEINLTRNVEVNLSDEHINCVWISKDADLTKFIFKNQNQRDIFEKFKKEL